MRKKKRTLQVTVDHENLNMARYDEYRFNLICEGFGTEVYIMEKLRTFRQMKEKVQTMTQ